MPEVTQTVSNEFLEERQALVQMYQQGFLDAWMLAHGTLTHKNSRQGKRKEVNTWERIKEKCKDCFEFRYMRKIGNNITKVRGLDKNE